jgi:hypothetical protein
MLRVIVLNVTNKLFVLSVIILNVVMKSVIILNVIMKSVVMLSVLRPYF